MTYQLETAEHPEKLRRVAIDPVSRVEGHGKVTILLDETNRVQQVRLHIVEFRGFEKFIEGRPYWEVPVMVQRLCGICPVSHHLAASKALDVIVGAKQLTPTAEKMAARLTERAEGTITVDDVMRSPYISSPLRRCCSASPRPTRPRCAARCNYPLIRWRRNIQRTRHRRRAFPFPVRQ